MVRRVGGGRRRDGRNRYRLHRRRSLGRVVHADTEICCYPGQSVCVALPDRTQLPFAAAPVDLEDDQGGLAGEVRRVEGGEQVTVGRIDDACMWIRPGERGGRGIEAGRDHHLVDGRRNGGQGDADCIGTVSSTGHMTQPRPDGRVEEDQVGVAAHLARRGHQQRRHVELPSGHPDLDADFGGLQRSVRARSHRDAHVAVRPCSTRGLWARERTVATKLPKSGNRCGRVVDSIHTGRSATARRDGSGAGYCPSSTTTHLFTEHGGLLCPSSMVLPLRWYLSRPRWFF